MARKVFETAAKSQGDSERDFVADYHTHSTATADKHYHMKTLKDVIFARKLLGQLAGESGSEPEAQFSISKRKSSHWLDYVRMMSLASVPRVALDTGALCSVSVTVIVLFAFSIETFFS
ncbi:uncharacterized protein LOC130428256 [Triplophysa dalaica]|uniref:uncharacterized protein LOC130428256 n=1 Tax=Triplophysa dalaica TaxID=1582913 RepID=UPI0024DFE35E|nr:uncharacterized protein LOC130428256 [Triplophysa dalaica]